MLCFFYKRKIRIAAICLGLQNALNISDNSSICNYYAVIIYKVCNSEFSVEGEIGRRNIA